MINRSLATRIVVTGGVCAWLTATAFAQVTPAGGYTPPDDTPKVNVGATIFGDYTYQQSPQIQDVDKNNVKLSSFNISRAYINSPTDRSFAPELGYAPLPKEVVALEMQALSRLRV